MKAFIAIKTTTFDIETVWISIHRDGDCFRITPTESELIILKNRTEYWEKQYASIPLYWEMGTLNKN